MWEKRNAYRALVGKPMGNRPLRRSWHRRADKTEMFIQEIEWEFD
jgi:hypothetical protein